MKGCCRFDIQYSIPTFYCSAKCYSLLFWTILILRCTTFPCSQSSVNAILTASKQDPTHNNCNNNIRSLACLIGHKFRIHPELSIHGNLHVLQGRLWCCCWCFIFIAVHSVVRRFLGPYYYYNAAKTRVRRDFTAGLGNGQMEGALNPSPSFQRLLFANPRCRGATTQAAEDCIESIFHLESSSNCTH